MDDFNFFIEGNTLFRQEITKTETPNIFTVRKVPVINKEAFEQIAKIWLPKEDEDDHR